MFDKFSNKVFVFNNGSGNAVVINAKTDEVVGLIELGGAPEFAVSDEKGMVYNNNEDTQEITVIDAKTNKVKARYSLLPNEVPTGLAMDIANNRLFSVCRKTKTLVVLDAANGKIIETLPIGGGVDAVVYDKALKMIFASNGDGNVTIVKQETANKYSVIQTLQTKSGCKTMMNSDKTHQLYLSGADYKEGTKDVMPNTFGVMVYGIAGK
jgi:YVTN family beta-propeller protein